MLLLEGWGGGVLDFTSTGLQGQRCHPFSIDRAFTGSNQCPSLGLQTFYKLFTGSKKALFCNILVEVLTEVWCLENIASWSWQKLAVARSDSVLLTLRSLVCMWKICRKGGYFLLSLYTACSMQLGTKRNYKVVEEKLLGFVLVY